MDGTKSDGYVTVRRRGFERFNREHVRRISETGEAVDGVNARACSRFWRRKTRDVHDRAVVVGNGIG